MTKPQILYLKNFPIYSICLDICTYIAHKCTQVFMCLYRDAHYIAKQLVCMCAMFVKMSIYGCILVLTTYIEIKLNVMYTYVYKYLYCKY